MAESEAPAGAKAAGNSYPSAYRHRATSRLYPDAVASGQSVRQIGPPALEAAISGRGRISLTRFPALELSALPLGRSTGALLAPGRCPPQQPFEGVARRPRRTLVVVEPRGLGFRQRPVAQLPYYQPANPVTELQLDQIAQRQAPVGLGRLPVHPHPVQVAGPGRLRPGLEDPGDL